MSSIIKDKNILIVDDERNINFTIKSILEVASLKFMYLMTLF